MPQAELLESTADSTSDTSMSDDQILDRAIGAESDSPPAKVGDDQSSAEAKGVTAPEAVTEQSTEPQDEPESAIEEPENLKQAFKKSPEFRRAYYSEKAYREQFPTVGEAREMRMLFPTLEEAKRIRQQAEYGLAAETAFLQDPNVFLSILSKTDQKAFQSLVGAVPKAASRMGTAFYRSAIAEPIVRGFLQNVAEAAQSDNDEDLSTAVRAIQERFVDDGSERRRPARDPEHEALLSQANERQRELSAYFDDSINRSYIEKTSQSIDEALTRLAPDMSEKAMGRVREEIMQQVLQGVTSNTWLNNQVVSLRSNGRMDSEHLNQVVSLLLGHSKPLLPGIVKKVISEWSNEVLTASNKRREAVVKQAEHKDVGTGGPSDSSGRDARVNRYDPAFYRKYSDDDIIEGRHRG